MELLTGSNAVPFVDCGMTAYRIPGFYPSENSWRVQFTDECKPYEYMHLLVDTSWVAAEWLRFFSLVVGMTTAMFLWTSTCLTLRPNYWKGAGVGSAIACLFQMCSFVWFYTKLCHTSTTNFGDFEAGREVELATASSATSECTLFFGSKCVITSCVLWGAAAALILLREYPMPVPKLVDQAELVNMVHGNKDGSLSNQAQQSTNNSRSNSSFGIAPAKRKGNMSSSERTRFTASMSSDGSAPWVNTLPPEAGEGNNDIRASLRTSMRPTDGPVMNVRPRDEFSALSFQGASRGR